MKRTLIDFTDKELHMISLGLEAYANQRNCYYSESAKIIFRNVVNKVIRNGLERKSGKSIIRPIYRELTDDE